MADANIPKIIHYCHFGEVKFDDAILSAWKKICPDYKYICWDESSIDFSFSPYLKEAYDRGMWAFVSDVVRLQALYQYGGIYLDTDVELVKSFDELLINDMFWGFESDSSVGTAVIGSALGNSIIRELLDQYKYQHFIVDGDADLTTNVQRVSRFLEKSGFVINGKLQEKDGVVIYPQEYFSPKDFVTGEINLTPNTFAVHHFSASWKSEEEKMRDSIFFKLKRRLPEKIAWNMASYVSVMKCRGIIKGHRDMFRLLARGKSK